MKLFQTLNEDVFTLFAARHYYNPTCIDAEEFHEDLKRFTRNNHELTQEDINTFISGLNLTDEIKNELNKITIYNY